jgi:osmotically-inducible protein OsmY
MNEDFEQEIDQANWMQLQYPKPRESFSSRVNYSGLGPKGYKRSDERIREDVCDKLQKHSLIDASEIEVDVSDGCVYLKGYVSSRNIKRLAENAIQNISGVMDVQNLLKIKQYDF